MKPVTTRLPEREMVWLEELEDELGADRAEVLRRLIREGLAEWRKTSAVTRTQSGQSTIRAAADYADITYVEMLHLLEEEAVRSGYGTEELNRDLERFDGRP